MNSKYTSPASINLKLRVSHREGERGFVIAKRRVPRKNYVPPNRTLHLVDLENLMGGTDGGYERAVAAVNNYRAAMPVNSGDHIHIGVNPHLLLEAGLSWPQARILTQSGPDGADRALIDSVRDVPGIAARYDRIVIGSGDHAFEVVATSYRALGIPVGVVAPYGSLSRSLDQSASFVIGVTNLSEVLV